MGRENYKLPTFDKLLRLNKAFGVAAIAKHYSVSREAVYYHFRKAGKKPVSHSSIDRRLPSPSELSQMNQSMTLRELQKELGVSRSTISRYLRKNNFKPANHKRGCYPRSTRMPLKKIKQLLRSGLRVHQIAKVLETTTGTIFSKVYRSGETVKEIRRNSSP